MCKGKTKNAFVFENNRHNNHKFLYYFKLFLPSPTLSLYLSMFGFNKLDVLLGTSRDSKFHYKEGTIYNYLYTVNGTIHVNEGPPEQSGLHFSSNATVHFLTDCDAVLYVSAVLLYQLYN